MPRAPKTSPRPSPRPRAVEQTAEEMRAAERINRMSEMEGRDLDALRGTRKSKKMASGGKVKKMQAGGKCRGMGKATKGGKYSRG